MLAQPETTLYTTIDSPLGELLLTGDGEALRSLRMRGGRRRLTVDRAWTRADEPFADARAQLDEYFSGARTGFDLALAPAGSGFQSRVWRMLLEIPYGRTVSYGELARRVGTDASPRAVGSANGANPISIIVPCHRVIGADGSLIGYGGGLERKRALLELEGATLALGAAA
jgi:methylated-DNA-[protein]-cysteine S-methyltransferase